MHDPNIVELMARTFFRLPYLAACFSTRTSRHLFHPAAASGPLSVRWLTACRSNPTAYDPKNGNSETQRLSWTCGTVDAIQKSMLRASRTGYLITQTGPARSNPTGSCVKRGGHKHKKSTKHTPPPSNVMTRAFSGKLTTPEVNSGLTQANDK